MSSSALADRRRPSRRHDSRERRRGWRGRFVVAYWSSAFWVAIALLSASLVTAGRMEAFK